MCDYIRTVMIKDIIIEPHKINKKIDDVILFNLKRLVEGRCLDKGFVREGSVNVIKRSAGFFSGSLFNASVKFRIVYSCDLCNPSKGDKIKCTVTNINEYGIKGELGALRIMVPKQIQSDKSIFKTIKPGDEIETVVIDKKYDINDKFITVAAMIDEDKLFANMEEEDITVPDEANAKKNTTKEKNGMVFQLSSMDVLENDIDINSIANELELSDSEDTDEFYRSNVSEVKTEDMEEESDIESYEELTGKNDVNLQDTDILMHANDPDEQEEEAEEEANAEEESNEEEESDDENSEESEEEETDEDEEDSDEEMSGGNLYVKKYKKNAIDVDYSDSEDSSIDY